MNRVPTAPSLPFRRLRSFARASTTAAVLVVATACGADAARAAERVELPIAGPGASGVISSLVRLRVPLPAGTPPHPEACDWIAYERFRDEGGPLASLDADAVTVLMPGLSEGATAFDQLARNTIREARRRGRHVEVWALDRRANCLEDLAGLELLERTGDEDLTLDYYYRGAAIDGKRFGGWDRDDAFLAEIGVKQTVLDMHAVLTEELPDQAWREQHVVCGGHSLGGPLVSLFSGWDFDGDAGTSADAGWRQCAGFIGFDTILDVDPRFSNPRELAILNLLTGGRLRWAQAASNDALRRGRIQRHFEIPGITPQALALVEALATKASTDPEGEATETLARIPRSKEMESYFHLAGSVDAARFLISNDSVRNHRYTFTALLGQLLDDNGAPYSLVRASLGFFDGAPIRRNVLANQVRLVPGLNILLQPGNLAVPRGGANQPVMRWRNYDAPAPAPGQLGAGFTTPADEVTDIREFSRLMHEGPTNLVEAYFPTRIITDVAAASVGDRTGDLAPLLWDQPVRRKPRLAVMAGDGVFLKGNFRSLDPNIVLPGYDHLDVITAAEKQNDGRPEGSSQALADLIDQVVPD